MGVLSALLLVAGTAAAEQWYIEPRASLRTFYNDNVRLVSRGEQGSSGTIARLNAQLGRRTEVSNINIDLGLSNDWYADVPELTTTDGYLGLGSQYQLQRGRLGLDARVDYDSTRTSELATSGLVQVNKRRTKLLIEPSWSYTLGERASLDLSARYQDVSYEDVELLPLYNYRFATLTANGRYLLNERATLFSRLSYDRYEADSVGASSDSVGLLLGGEYAFSESLSLSALAGVRHTSATRATLLGDEDQTSTGVLADLRLEKRFEVGRLLMSASQSLLPSSTGALTNTTSASIALDYPITALWSLDLSASAYLNRNLDARARANDRDYFSVSPGLSRKLSDWWALSLGYRFRYQKYSLSEREATSNALFLTLRYTWPTEPIGQWSVLR